MPHAHRAIHEWLPDRFLRWAGDIGPQTQQVVTQLLQQKLHKEQSSGQSELYHLNCKLRNPLIFLAI